MPRGLSFAKRVRGSSSLARPRSLRAETPSTATQRRVPCRGPSVSPALRAPRHPVPVRALGPRGRGRHGRCHPLGGLNAPLPQSGGTTPTTTCPVWRDGSSRSAACGRVVVKSAPRAKGAITPERAGTERASRGGVSLAWSHTNSEGPHRGTSLLGRTQRGVGGLRSMRSPSDRSEPAGQKETLTEWITEQGRAPAGQETATQ